MLRHKCIIILVCCFVTGISSYPEESTTEQANTACDNCTATDEQTNSETPVNDCDKFGSNPQSEASEGEYPFVCAIQFRLSPKNPFTFCIGSIISKTYILTAAHCVIDLPPNIKTENICVACGTVDALSDDSSVQVVYAQQIIIHPEYTIAQHPYPPANNVALINLQKPLRFNSNARSIRIVHDDIVQSGSLLGWGGNSQLYEGSLSSAPLYVGDGNVISNTECEKFDVRLSNTTFCVENPIQAVCRSDWTGLYIQKIKGNENTLAGIVVYRKIHCGFRPAVLIKIGQYIRWIKEIIRKN